MNTEINSRVTVTLLQTSYTYIKSVFVQNALWKWIPAGLVTLLIDIRAVYIIEIFWVVIVLWSCDLIIGFLKAWHNDAQVVDWMKVFKSVVKLFVICITPPAMVAAEKLLQWAGINPGGRLVFIALTVVGMAETFSILSNLSYFWPEMSTITNHLKSLLGKQHGDEDDKSLVEVKDDVG